MMLISIMGSVVADTSPVSILVKSADRSCPLSEGSLAVDPVDYSTNMPKLLKNLYNEPFEKARGKVYGNGIAKKLSSAPIMD